MPDTHTAVAASPLVIVRPEEGKSFWQPVPANGFVRCILASAAFGGSTDFSMGTQTVDPGCHVREHVHDANDEIIFVLEGSGEALIDGGARHPMVKGTCFYFGAGHSHSFHNTGTEPMTFMWLILPGGLDTFFERIGRPRQPGDPSPAPFPRPTDVLKIEAETVFGTLPKRD